MSKTGASVTLWRPSRYQIGGVMFEFMICAVLFMLFVMSIIQYGVIMFNVNALNHVARETARYAEVHGLETTADDQATDPISIRGELQSLCAHSPLSYSNFENTAAAASPALITPASVENGGTRASGQLVTITLVYNMKPVIFLNSFVPGLSSWNTWTVESTSVIDVTGTAL